MKHPEIHALLKKHKITVESVFVPWSKSRNAGEKNPSLNWVVTVKRDGRQIVTTDYSAGMAHAPFYKHKLVTPMRLTVWAHGRILAECEKGFAVDQTHGENIIIHTKAPILPDPLDVISSLLLDSEVIDHPNFESWAMEFGYNPDSRADEAIYNACMKIALSFRSLGDSTIAELRQAFQDY